MRSLQLRTLGIAMIGSLICALSHSQEPAVPSADISVEFEMEHRSGEKKVGSISHERNTKELAAAPLVNRFTGLNDRSYVVTISYVGYVSFEVAKDKNDGQFTSGHVFAVQVFSGKKGVTIETAETNVTKLIVYQQSPQTLYEDEGVSVIMRNKKE